MKPYRTVQPNAVVAAAVTMVKIGTLPGKMWLNVTIIPALRRWRQEDQEFKAIFRLITSSGLCKLQEPLFQKKKKIRTKGSDLEEVGTCISEA